MKTPLLEGSQLSWQAGDGRLVFKDLSFAVHGGQLLLVTGPNGSGKSTLLRILLGRESAARGLVRKTIAPEKIAHLPQMQNMEFHLPLTLREVIEITHHRPVEEEDITKFGLLQSEKLDLTWNTASGGERQRTLLTCALLEEPQLLLLDEPMNHLDEKSQAAVLQSLVRFLKSDRAIVMVSHQGLEASSALGVPVVRLEMGGS